MKKAAENVLATAIKTGWNIVSRAGLDSAVKSIVPSAWYQFGSKLQDEAHYNTEWDETQAFFTTLSGQAVYINLEERFSKGTVPNERYDEVIEKLRASLLSMRHPDTNEEIVEAVIRSGEEFDGWKVEDAPDLILRTASGYTMKGGYSESLIQTSTQRGNDRSGDHRLQGILLANGPSFDKGVIEGASILDIAPTLLHLHRCPVPSTIGGSVLTRLFSEAALEKRDITKTDDYGQSETIGRQWNEEEEAELEERLSDMGYLN